MAWGRLCSWSQPVRLGRPAPLLKTGNSHAFLLLIMPMYKFAEDAAAVSFAAAALLLLMNDDYFLEVPVRHSMRRIFGHLVPVAISKHGRLNKCYSSHA